MASRLSSSAGSVGYGEAEYFQGKGKTCVPEWGASPPSPPPACSTELCSPEQVLKMVNSVERLLSDTDASLKRFQLGSGRDILPAQSRLKRQRRRNFSHRGIFTVQHRLFAVNQIYHLDPIIPSLMAVFGFPSKSPGL